MATVEAPRFTPESGEELKLENYADYFREALSQRMTVEETLKGTQDDPPEPARRFAENWNSHFSKSLAKVIPEFCTPDEIEQWQTYQAVRNNNLVGRYSKEQYKEMKESSLYRAGQAVKDKVFDLIYQGYEEDQLPEVLENMSLSEAEQATLQQSLERGREDIEALRGWNS